MSSKNTESSEITSKDQPAPQAVRTRGAGSARSIANLTKDTSNPKDGINPNLNFTNVTSPENVQEDKKQEDEKSSSLVTVLIAVGANVIIAIAKTVAAFMTGSASMIAESAHSWADAGNGTLLIVAEKKAVKPADNSHPLGYGKESYVWSMIAAFGVFMAGSIVSIYTGITEWNAPETETNYTIGFIILAVAFVLEGFSLVQAYLQSKKHGQAINVSALGYVVNTSNPTLRGVFFEDLAAVDIAGNQQEQQIAQKFEDIENQFRANPLFQEAILTLSVPNAEILRLPDDQCA
ncbi:cation transporter [uncultured Psychrobacter sp.]|uniref:cation diffusion facilitator family transporter n=1 Tax=uncultured Psychrobacter sp. TaxID=259303 RepID=UPI002593C83E|nr:cation transporter [uncultured Psychrobacter sp.]